MDWPVVHGRSVEHPTHNKPPALTASHDKTTPNLNQSRTEGGPNYNPVDDHEMATEEHDQYQQHDDEIHSQYLTDDFAQGLSPLDAAAPYLQTKYIPEEERRAQPIQKIIFNNFETLSANP